MLVDGSSANRRRQRGPTLPKSSTFFGHALDELRDAYKFHNRDLAIDQILTPTNIQQLSRMSNDRDDLLSMNADHRMQLIDSIAKAIVTFLGNHQWSGLDIPPRVEEGICRRLVDAVQQDREAYLDQSSAMVFADWASEQTGLSIRQLALYTESPGFTLNDLVQIASGGEQDASRYLQTRPDSLPSSSRSR
jgi:hypothetical protein